MAKARVPVIADPKVTARLVAELMAIVAPKVIVDRKVVGPKVTADQKAIAVPMLAAPRANVVNPHALIDLVVRVKSADRNVIVSSREMVKSRATASDALTRFL